MKRYMIILLAVVALSLPILAEATVTIKLRGDTAANWTSANPTLAAREAGVETDTRKLKIGDGATAWNSLPYVLAGSSALPWWIDLDTGHSFAIGDLAFYNATLWVAVADHAKAVDNYPQDPSDYWAEFSAGGDVDLTAPGPIGTATPDVGNFTVLTATAIDSGAPASGETGEMSLLEDPDNGTDRITLKAPADVFGDVVLTLPASDGTSGQGLGTWGSGDLAFMTFLRPVSNLSDVNSVSQARQNLGLADALPVVAPVDATDTCTAGQWAYGPSGYYQTGTISASAAIDNGDGTVGVPVTAHGYEAGEDVTITGTVNYDGTYTLPDQTAGGVDVVVITATYVAETFAGTETTVSTRRNDDMYVYICTAADTWNRVALGTWGE